jgi:hypothetical protein
MAGIVTVQGKITTTGTAQQLPSNPRLNATFTLTAKSTNTAAIAVTVSSAGGAVDGTGTGYILEKGTSITIPGLSDTNALWLTGTSNDIYSGIAP